MFQSNLRLIGIATIAFWMVLSPAHGQTIIVAADTNIISGLDPDLAQPHHVSDLAIRPNGAPQFFQNILQDGNSVFVDPSSHTNRGIVGGNVQIHNFYNNLPGVTSVKPGGDFTSTDLAGIDLLVTICPTIQYTDSELSAMQSLLDDGGTILFFGEAGLNDGYDAINSNINNALDYLQNGMRLEDVFTVVFWPRLTTSVATHPLMTNVPNLSVAVAGSVSGGTPLAFFHDDTTSYVMVAAEAAGPSVQEVSIDVKPGSEPNCFNINGNGVIPVAILGSDTFNVLDIVTSNLFFAGLEIRVRGKKGPLCHGEDSNGDGFLDLVCQFEDDPTIWAPDSSALGTLTGTLLAGTEFEGTDSICVAP